MKILFLLCIIVVIILVLMTYFKIIEAFNDNIEIDEGECRIYLTPETRERVYAKLKERLDNLLYINKDFANRIGVVENDLAELRKIKKPIQPKEITDPEPVVGSKPTMTLQPVTAPTPLSPPPAEVSRPVMGMNKPDAVELPKAPIAPTVVKAPTISINKPTEVKNPTPPTAPNKPASLTPNINNADQNITDLNNRINDTRNRINALNNEYNSLNGRRVKTVRECKPIRKELKRFNSLQAFNPGMQHRPFYYDPATRQNWATFVVNTTKNYDVTGTFNNAKTLLLGPFNPKWHPGDRFGHATYTFVIYRDSGESCTNKQVVDQAVVNRMNVIVNERNGLQNTLNQLTEQLQAATSNLNTLKSQEQQLQDAYKNSMNEYDLAMQRHNADLQAYKKYSKDKALYEAELQRYNTNQASYNKYIIDKKNYDAAFQKYQTDMVAYNQYVKNDEAYRLAQQRYNEDLVKYTTYLREKNAYDAAFPKYKAQLDRYNNYVQAQKKYQNDLILYNEQVAAYVRWQEAIRSYKEAMIFYDLKIESYKDTVNKIIDLEAKLEKLREDGKPFIDQLNDTQYYMEGLESSPPYIPIDGFVLGTHNRSTYANFDRIQDDQFIGNRAKCYRFFSGVDGFNSLQEELIKKFGEGSIRLEKREIKNKDKTVNEYVEITFMSQDIEAYIPALRFPMVKIETPVVLIDNFDKGLYWKRVEGADESVMKGMNYFKTAYTLKKGFVSDVSSVAFAFNEQGWKFNNTDNGVRDQAYGIEFIGLFKPSISGIWTFWLLSDDSSLLWIGDNAINGWKISNALVDNSGRHYMIEKSGSIEMKKDMLYPIRIQYWDAGGSDNLIVSFSGPGIPKRTDGTNMYYNTGDKFEIGKIQTYNKTLMQ